MQFTSEKLREAFKTLGLDESATKEDAKKAYRVLLKKYHPDRYANDKEKLKIAEAKSSEINTAYDIVEAYLNDPDNHWSKRSHFEERREYRASTQGDRPYAARRDYRGEEDIWRDSFGMHGSYKDRQARYREEAFRRMAFRKGNFSLFSFLSESLKLILYDSSDTFNRILAVIITFILIRFLFFISEFFNHGFSIFFR